MTVRSARSVHRRIARTAALIAGALLASIALSPATAGAQSERIIGGSTASGANWPSIARLQMSFTENGQGFTSSCGGTVVAPHWVLTAAHCTYGDASTFVPSNFTVIVGRTTLSATNTGQSIGVTEIVRHPNYNPNGGLGNDVALLRLASAASVAPMELAVQAKVGSYTSPASAFNTAGWGYTVPGNSSSGSDVLKDAYVPLRENADCSAALNMPGATFDPSTMVCAGAAQADGTTTCHGDSGGPLVVFTGSPARQVLWGVVSWGKPDCSAGISAFARVAAFTSFLRPVFDELSPAPAVSGTPPPPAPAVPVTPPPLLPPPPPPPPPVDTRPETQNRDTVAPRLARFVIPAIIRVRRGRPKTAITIKLRSDERATLRVDLLRRSGSRFIRLNRSYRVDVSKGPSRMSLPRGMWRLTPGAYRLRFAITDAAGNMRTYHAAIRVQRG